MLTNIPPHNVTEFICPVCAQSYAAVVKSCYESLATSISRLHCGSLLPKGYV